MDPKHLRTLAALAAISIVATALVLHTGAPTVASDRRGEKVAPSLLARADDITMLSIREGADTFVIERHNNRFVASDSGYPIRTDAVDDVIASSADLTFQEARTSDPARYGDLGLADPGGKDGGKEIAFRAAGGELARLLVGNGDTTTGGPDGGVFIRLNGQRQTFLVRGNVRLPAHGRAGWFVPIRFDVTVREIRKVALSGGGRDSVNILPDTQHGGFVLADVPEERTPDNLSASLLPNILGSFAFEDVRRASSPAADPRRMVIEASDGLRIIFTTLGDLTEGWMQVTAEASNEAAKDRATLINSKVEGYDFRLPSKEASQLGWTMSDLSVERKS